MTPGKVMHYDSEERLRIAKAICELYQLGGHTIEACCLANSIDDSTFRLWRTKHSEISDLFNETIAIRKKIFKVEIGQQALSALHRALKGSKTITTTVKHKPVYKNDVLQYETNDKGDFILDTNKQKIPKKIVKEIITQETEVLPNAALALQVLERFYPEDYAKPQGEEGNYGGMGIDDEQRDRVLEDALRVAEEEAAKQQNSKNE